MTKVLAASLVLDFNFYPRHKVDDYHVSEIRASMQAGVIMPPVRADKASKRVVDGLHRVTAALKEGGTDGKGGVIFKAKEN